MLTMPWSKKMRLEHRLAGLCLLAALLGITGCPRGLTPPEDDSVDLVSQGATLTSFNYTDRAINDITVDGVWGGGADAYSASGGAAGLLAPRDRTRQHSVKVRWEVDDVYDVATNRYLEPTEPPEQHEATLPIKFPYPEKIEFLILHFYPNGQVEAEFTERMPEPRIPPPEGFSR